MNRQYVQYGCGDIAPEAWANYDASPTLRIQKMPVLGALLKRQLNAVFPDNVLYGDIVKGLPVPDDSCSGVYCAHVLEHLSLEDCRKALKNTYRILKKGGIFRCVVPDLEYLAREYISSLERGDNNASLTFMGHGTLLGTESRIRGIRGIISQFWGNSWHQWMWDGKSLSKELSEAGFIQIRLCSFNDCEDTMFSFVEEMARFEKALAIECRK
jgi:SAM-dependent methyltransferase